MTAIFKIDQPGSVPPIVGAWDKASRDIKLAGVGGPVTFTAFSPAASYLWELVSEPPGPATPIVGANLSACQVAFTKTGGYIMRLTVDAGIPATEDVSERYVGIRLPNSNLPIPAFNELDFDNSVDPTGSVGTSEKLTEFFKWVDAAVGSGMANLPITRTYYVDGARVDVYVEDGSFGYPFKTITAGIAAAAAASVITPGEYCLHIRPFKYDEVDVVLPGNIHIDAEMGAELAPSTPSNGLVVVPGTSAPVMGVTFIRGLNIAGRGFGMWALKIQMPLPMMPFTAFVAHLDAGLGTYDTADLINVETGGLYLTDAGGYYGDSTNEIGLRVAPPVPGPVFQCVALIGMWNISANKHAFEIGVGGAVLAAETKVDVNTSPATGSMLYIDGGLTPMLGALFMGKNLRFGGDWQGLVDQHGYSLVQLDTSDGNNPAMLSSYLTDIFLVHGGYIFLTGGAYATPSGRGLALLADEADVYGWFKNVDISAEPGGGMPSPGYLIETGNIPGPPGVGTTVTAEMFNCRFRSQFTPARTYTRFAHTQGNIYMDGGVVEGGGGGSTIIDHVGVGGLLWLTGGIDINANQWSDTAIHVAAGATVAHGHANVRVGQVVFDPGAVEMPLTSSFAGINLGKYDSITKCVARRTLAEVATFPYVEDGYDHGSIAVITGGAKPLVYINYGTNAARDWRLLADYSRIQVDLCGSVNLNGKTRVVPAYLSWAHVDYDDNPPYLFAAPASIITVLEDGDYRLSYHVPWQTDALLAFGTSVGVMWEYKPSGGAWTELPNTLSLDTAANIINDRGCNDLPSYEKFFTAGTELRVKAYIDTGVVGDVFINNDPAENWAWARVEKGGVGGSGGGSPVTDWTVEFVTANRVLDATDHKKTLVVLVDLPNTVTITLPLTPFIGQEIRVVHGGALTLGPLSGHMTVLPAVPTDKGIGIADSDFSQLDADSGGNVAHLVCMDDGSGYWSSRFWGCGDGSGTWYDATHLGIFPAPPPYNSNQFYSNFQSPFRSSRGGASAIQLYGSSAVANGVFSLAFGYNVETTREYSLAFGCLAKAHWIGEEVFASGGFTPLPGTAQKSSINLYGETVPGTPGNVTPTGLDGIPLTVEDLKVYACELLVVAASTPRMPGPPLAASWKMEFLVHGMGLVENAVIVGSINKNQFSRDPSPIIDAWDVNISMAGPGVPLKNLAVTVYQGVVGAENVRWDAVLTMAQVVIEEMPS